jgi:hypothetical protein
MKLWEEPVFYIRSEFFTTVTMKSPVFWDIESDFVPHRIHITSSLQSSAGESYIRFEVSRW